MTHTPPEPPSSPPPASPPPWNQPPWNQPTGGRQPPYQQPPQWGQPQYQQPQWGPPANPFDSESTPILVTGILSIVVCGPVGLYAWIAGNKLRNRANAAGWPEPANAKVGRILGIVGTILGSVWVLAVVGWFVFLISLSGRGYYS